MSYTPTEWVDGDIITAQKLNKMEGGIAAAVCSNLKLEITDNVETPIISNATYSDIAAAVENGGVVFAKIADGENVGQSYIAYVNGLVSIPSESTYGIVLISVTDNNVIQFTFVSDSADGVLQQMK